MHYVYILYSNKSDLFYVGISTDVKLRLQFHNHFSTTSFTSKHRPWTLQVSFSVPDEAIAIRIERYIVPTLCIEKSIPRWNSFGAG